MQFEGFVKSLILKYLNNINMHTANSNKDFMLQEGLARFVREQTPVRAVFAKGTGAYGTFTVSNDLSAYTSATLFSKTGNSCKVFARFSSMPADKGSADAARAPKGFALKFYTENGNWDLTGSNFPVFFIKDSSKFPALIQAQGRSKKTNLYDKTAYWDFLCHNPETLHHLLMTMSGRGIPQNYRFMDGFSGNTYSFINAENEKFWVKFHLISQQGFKFFTDEEAAAIAGHDPDHAQKDLVTSIENGDFPKWKMYAQIMTDEQARECKWNPFDVTKVWLHEEFPLVEIGTLELNELPENYTQHVEKSAFSPSQLIDGIGLSPDSVLQARLFAYTDAQRYRLGNGFDQLEVNRCPFTGNGSLEDNFYDEKSEAVQSYEDEDDHFTQPGLFYTKALKTQEERDILTKNIVAHMSEISGEKRSDIINRQLCHFFRADVELGMKIAMGLNINIDMNMMSHAK